MSKQFQNPIEKSSWKWQNRYS